MAPCKPAGTDFENIWRYAGLHGRISKKFGAMQTLVPPKQEFFEVRTVFEGRSNAVRRRVYLEVSSPERLERL